MRFYRAVAAYLFFLVAAFIILFWPYILPDKQATHPGNQINILTYSSFIKNWGPGPELATLFKEKYGTDIHWIDAGNAGLILERLRFKKNIDLPDVVLGFDQFSLLEARRMMNWRDIHDAYDVSQNILPKGSSFRDFFAFDWGPLTFVYRDGEIQPPDKLGDLLKPEFRKKLILQDPRMSSPGLQFLFWALQVFGKEEGIKFLNQLKESTQILAPSWSSSYSLFQVNKGSMVFSYFTSPFYHLKEESRGDYRAAVFDHPHPVQVEYAGIPEICINCQEANQFIEFLATAEAQKIIHERNYMLPMNGAVLDQSDFKMPRNIKFFSPIESWQMIRDKRDIVDQWKRVFY